MSKEITKPIEDERIELIIEAIDYIPMSNWNWSNSEEKKQYVKDFLEWWDSLPKVKKDETL